MALKSAFGAHYNDTHGPIQRGRRRSGHPGKSQVDIGFHKKSGTDPLEKPLAPIASRGRSAWPSVKNVDEKKLKANRSQDSPSHTHTHTHIPRRYFLDLHMTIHELYLLIICFITMQVDLSLG